MPVIQPQIGPRCCDQERSAILFRDAATATSPDGSCQVRRSCMPNQGHIGDRSSAQPMATIPDQGRKLDKDSLRAPWPRTLAAGVSDHYVPNKSTSSLTTHGTD
jgi:hypothetical protein